MKNVKIVIVGGGMERHERTLVHATDSFEVMVLEVRKKSQEVLALNASSQHIVCLTSDKQVGAGIHILSIS